MAVLRRTRYKRDRLDPLLIPLVTEVLTHLPENPAQFMLKQLTEYVAKSQKIQKGKADSATAADQLRRQPNKTNEIETEKEKKMADLIKLSVKQEEMLVCVCL